MPSRGAECGLRGNRAVRNGRWKLVSKENGPWELYDMERDRTELHDLSGLEPLRARELAARWEAYATRANVLPPGAWRGKNTNATAYTKNFFPFNREELKRRDPGMVELPPKPQGLSGGK